MSSLSLTLLSHKEPTQRLHGQLAGPEEAMREPNKGLRRTLLSHALGSTGETQRWPDCAGPRLITTFILQCHLMRPWLFRRPRG